MKKKLIAFVMILNLLLIPGCWSRREVEDLAIVTAIGIDRMVLEGKEKDKISVLVARPSQLGGQQTKASAETNADWLVSEVGDTLYDAMRKIHRRSPRNMRIYHNELVIISENSARDGVEDVFDYLQRHKDIRLRTWMFVCRGEAGEAMKVLPEFENMLSEEISEILVKSTPGVSETLAVDLRKFSDALVTPGWDAVLPVIRVIESGEAAGSKREEKEAGQTIMLEGLAIFHNNRLAGFMSPEEVTGFLYIIGETQRGAITLEHKSGNGSPSQIALLISRASSKLKPVFQEGRLVMEINIKAEADVVEVQGDAAVGSPEVIKELNREFGQKVKSIAEGSLETAQKKFKTDIFGFGKKVHQKYPDYWKEVEQDWYEIYPEVPVTVKVDAKIRRTSVIADPFQIR
ncbi:Ger(x)C family spore germination protein [Phosphitispora fastidiosa]|uniref:Ger(x)C family spore germination protein n=1 Tax=Phosphitispora fastidiosa TaxID=2837202 RepID=UPI001E47E5EF|nr:spore germination protein KC [Phosphitispora fastidiosa]